jgi:RNA recognition motif-containing protein
MEQSTTGRLKNRGFAFVTYSKIEHANRAIQEGEVEVDNMCLEIERAMKTRPRENKEQMLK